VGAGAGALVGTALAVGTGALTAGVGALGAGARTLDGAGAETDGADGAETAGAGALAAGAGAEMADADGAGAEMADVDGAGADGAGMEAVPVDATEVPADGALLPAVPGRSEVCAAAAGRANTTERIRASMKTAVRPPQAHKHTRRDQTPSFDSPTLRGTGAFPSTTRQPRQTLRCRAITLTLCNSPVTSAQADAELGGRATARPKAGRKYIAINPR